MKQYLFSIAFGILLLGVFFSFEGTEMAFAETATTTTVATNTVKGLQTTAEAVNSATKLQENFASIASYLVGIFTPLVAVLIKLISSLMSDEYVFGSNSSGQNNVAQLLYEVWNISRSIVNYMILLALMFAALVNVATPFKEKYDVIKTYIPKLIIAAILVNMTWFGVRVIMDASEVATHAVYSLPQTVFGANERYKSMIDPNDEKNKCLINVDQKTNQVTKTGNCNVAFQVITPTGNFTGVNQLGTSAEAKTSKESVVKDLQTQQAEIDKLKDMSHEAKTEAKAAIEKQIAKVNAFKTDNIVNYGAITIFWEDFNYDAFNQGTIAPLFAYSIMQIQNLPQIATKGLTEATKGLEIQGTSLNSGWISIMINAVIALVIIIMLMVLFVMMTIVLIFRIIIIWINIMVAPFYVFSSVGLLDVFKKIESNSKGYIGLGPFINSVFAPVLMGIPMVIGFILIMAGTSLRMFPEISNGAFLTGPLVNGMSSIHEVFYYILCIAVLWMGTQAAIKSAAGDTFFGKWADKLGSTFTGLMTGAMKAPLYANIIPVMGADGSVKTASLGYYMNKMQSPDLYFGYSDKINQTAEELGGKTDTRHQLKTNAFDKDEAKTTAFFNELSAKGSNIKEKLNGKQYNEASMKTAISDNTDLNEAFRTSWKDLSKEQQKLALLHLYGKTDAQLSNIDTDFTTQFPNNTFPNNSSSNTAPAPVATPAPAPNPAAANPATTAPAAP